jgi:hypothetical protein
VANTFFTGSLHISLQPYCASAGTHCMSECHIINGKRHSPLIPGTLSGSNQNNLCCFLPETKPLTYHHKAIIPSIRIIEMAGSESPARRGDFVEEMKSAVQIVTPAVQPSGRKRSCAIPGWKSLLLMFSMLLIGTLTAIGHAQVYQFLDGRSIEEVPISQAWIIRAGIGFAFLFKTVLVVAVGTVFCQVFWFMIRRDALQVGTIDACFGVLQNPLHVFNRELWKKRLALIILATIAWCIPLAAIFSPGTLTGY